VTVEIAADTKLEAKASGPLDVKGGIVTVQANGPLQLRGAVVQSN
jgi:hypothetical protein